MTPSLYRSDLWGLHGPVSRHRSQEQSSRVCRCLPALCTEINSAIAGMEHLYSEHEASAKNGNTFAKMGNGHTDSHADKVLLELKALRLQRVCEH